MSARTPREQERAEADALERERAEAPAYAIMPEQAWQVPCPTCAAAAGTPCEHRSERLAHPSPLMPWAHRERRLKAVEGLL